MTTLVVIPARGGSKGIPRKNLADLGGRPLLAWTIDAALRSGVVDRVLVSSDDEEILSVATTYGAGGHRRSSALAQDEVHSVNVVLEVLDRAEQSPDRVLMLLPTSPFRAPQDIVGAVALFDDRRPPAVVSVTAMDKSLIHLRHLDDSGRLEPLAPYDQLTGQRQEQRPLYLLNGSIYVSTPQELQRNGTFHVRGALGYVMPQERSVDIDSPADLAAARSRLRPEGRPE